MATPRVPPTFYPNNQQKCGNGDLCTANYDLVSKFSMVAQEEMVAFIKSSCRSCS